MESIEKCTNSVICDNAVYFSLTDAEIYEQKYNI